MKRTGQIRKVLCVLLLCGFLLPCLPQPAAAENSGLAAFDDMKSYSKSVFSDISDAAWYAASVKTVYEKGIMDGVGNGTFAPAGTVTWTQAVAIAARIHSVYNGTEIPTAAGPWYLPYMDYARTAGLLPATCPEDSKANDAKINRQELAALFRNVLSEGDLPEINNATPPDLDKVDSRYRQGVQDMYASGIFTGKSGGMFDPNGLTTRAEIATIVTRLLCPAQRVSGDSLANQAMAGQLGNFYQGGIVVETGDTMYYLVCETCWEEGNGEIETPCLFTLVERRDDGTLRDVYHAQPGQKMERLSLGDDGMLYVIQDTALLRIAPATGKTETLYTSRYEIRGYLLYNGAVYLCDQITNPVDPYEITYKLVEWNNGKTKVLIDKGLDWNTAFYMDKSLYGFGGKLYYVYGDSTYVENNRTWYNHSLWSYDLKTGKQAKVLELSGRNAPYSSTIAYDGATVWLLEYADQDTHYYLCRFNVLMPELIETVTEVPELGRILYFNMYANASDLYYQTSGGRMIWRVSPSGEFHELFRPASAYVDHSTVTRQGIFANSQPWLNFIANEKIEVLLPDGTKTFYTALLCKPYILTGQNAMPAAYGENKLGAPKPVAGELTSDCIREYCTAQGDYAIEIKIINQLGKEVEWGCFDFTVGDQNSTWNRRFYPDPLPAEGETVYTIVIPAHTLGHRAVSDDIAFSYTFNYRYS